MNTCILHGLQESYLVDCAGEERTLLLFQSWKKYMRGSFKFLDQNCMILIAGVVLSLVSYRPHQLLSLLLQSSRGGQKLCYKNNFKRVISICAFLPHCLIFPLRSETCKLLFETISDPTTLHFTAEGKLTGFALIIQIKRFLCLLTFSCSDWANWYCCGRRPDSYWGTHLWSCG